MATATVKKAPPLDESLYTEAESFKKAAAQVATAKPETLIDNLAFARDAVKRLDQDYKDRTAKIAEKLAPFEADRSVLKSAFESAEKKFEERLLEIFKEKKTLPAETDNGVRLTVALLDRLGLREGWAWSGGNFAVYAGDPEADDYFYIGNKYIKPLAECIDWKAVEKDLAANAALIAADEPPKYRTDFAQVTKKVSLRPKLPEV